MCPVFCCLSFYIHFCLKIIENNYTRGETGSCFSLLRVHIDNLCLCVHVILHRCVEMLINEQMRRYIERLEEIEQLEYAETLAKNQLKLKRSNTVRAERPHIQYKPVVFLSFTLCLFLPIGLFVSVWCLSAAAPVSLTGCSVCFFLFVFLFFSLALFCCLCFYC